MTAQSMTALPSLVKIVGKAEPWTISIRVQLQVQPKAECRWFCLPNVLMLAVQLLSSLQFFGHSFNAEFHQSCGTIDCRKWQHNTKRSVNNCSGPKPRCSLSFLAKSHRANNHMGLSDRTPQGYLTEPRRATIMQNPCHEASHEGSQDVDILVLLSAIMYEALQHAQGCFVADILGLPALRQCEVVHKAESLTILSPKQGCLPGMATDQQSGNTIHEANLDWSAAEKMHVQAGNRARSRFCVHYTIM